MAAARRYWEAMEDLLARRVLPISAEALGLPASFFDTFYACEGGRTGANALRLAHYPTAGAGEGAGEAHAGKKAGKTNKGGLSYGEHTDYQGFTLLRADPRVGGLEVRFPDGEWRAVPPMGGDAIIVNAGDLIQRWTNDTWTSALHRVVPPSRVRNGGGGNASEGGSGCGGGGDGNGSGSGIEGGEGGSGRSSHHPSRLSLVYFTGPRHDALVNVLPINGPPRYTAITAGDHLNQKIAASNV